MVKGWVPSSLKVGSSRARDAKAALVSQLLPSKAAVGWDPGAPAVCHAALAVCPVACSAAAKRGSSGGMCPPLDATDVCGTAGPKEDKTTWTSEGQSAMKAEASSPRLCLPTYVHLACSPACCFGQS